MVGRLPRPLKDAVARALRAPLVLCARGRPRGQPRITFLITAAWGMGGTIRTTLNLAGYLAAQGWPVEVVSVGRGREKPFFGEFPPGVRVVALEDKRPKALPGRRQFVRRLLRSLPSVLIHPRDRAAPGFNLWVDLRLVRALRGRRGVLITTRPGLNMIAARLAPPGLALIGQEHMNLGEHHEELRREMPKLYPRLDLLTVLTEGDREAYAAHLGGGVPIVRIPNTVRDMGSEKADLASRVVLAAGRLKPQKGYDLLVPAFAQVAARHPDWRLRICGDGPERDLIEALIEEHGLADAVTLEGPSRDLGADMERAAVFVLSSRWEGLPLVLLEAMSKGMAVVSFDCPTGPADVIEDHQNGLLVPPEDVDALAAGMIELIEDEGLRRHCAAGAAQTAREYEMAAVGPRWEALLEELWTSS